MAGAPDAPLRQAPNQPELTTPQLVLRPFDRLDIDRVVELAGEREVADNTLNVPHPYLEKHAEEWIGSHPGQLSRLESITYAVTSAEDGALLGAVGLILETDHDRAELGYWIGKPFWGRGYATEAAAAIVDWAFSALQLHRIHSGHFSHNPASGRVLRKLGMRHEGRLREHVRKGDRRIDLEQYALLRSEWVERGRTGQADRG